ncbi:MAG: lipase family protein [Bacteroidales bacterium]|nr:lipase family protein [Bacteroidales bacterium]
MKNRFLVALALVALAFTSCNREEVLDGSDILQTIVEENNFEVIEESEISGQELFKQFSEGFSQYASAEDISRIENSYNEAFNNTPSLGPDTKAIVPALYKTVKVEYKTPDQSGNLVSASALIVYPLFKKINNVMLINHGTHIDFMLVPTQYTSVEGIMAATGALCIMPDYIGLGSTSNHPDLYLNHDVHGTTSIDALITLLDYAKAKRLPLASDYKTYILGYSQGGSVSLASLRELQRRDKATQDRVHLEKVYCGDGPYDLRATFETYLEDYNNGKGIGLGTVIPFVINSMFNSYPSEVADMNYEDFFTPWALKTNVPQVIRANKENLFDVMLKFAGKNLGDILNMDFINNNPDKLSRLLSLMDRQNLCVGWQPQYRLKLLHGNPDGVVPFANFEEAYANLNNEYMEEPQILEYNPKLLGDPLLQHIAGMLVMIEQVLAGKL